MQVRHSKLYSGLFGLLGVMLVTINVILLSLGARPSGASIGIGIMLAVIGLLTWGKPLLSIREGEFAMHNPYGMRLRKTPRETLELETKLNGKRVLYGFRKGKRRKLVTLPQWTMNKEDVEVFLSSVEAETAFD